MKSLAEINAEIKKLRKVKPLVRQFNIFGGDNHAGIDAQILVLENGLTVDDCDERWPEGFGSEPYDSARYAADWLEGGEELPPSEDLPPLDK